MDKEDFDRVIVEQLDEDTSEENYINTSDEAPYDTDEESRSSFESVSASIRKLRKSKRASKVAYESTDETESNDNDDDDDPVTDKGTKTELMRVQNQNYNKKARPVDRNVELSDEIIDDSDPDATVQGGIQIGEERLTEAIRDESNDTAETDKNTTNASVFRYFIDHIKQEIEIPPIGDVHPDASMEYTELKHTPDLDDSSSDTKELSDSDLDYIENLREKQKRKYRKQCTCKICGEHFLSSNSLKKHAVVHQMRYECDVCKQIFKAQAYLELHMAGHDQSGKHQCRKCGRKFVRKCDLEKHKILHEGKRLFKCTICGDGFSQASSLYKHRAWHSGKNTCKYCGKSFKVKLSFRKHVLEHEKQLNISNGLARFQCGSCKQVFKNELNLENHIRKMKCPVKFSSKGRRAKQCPHCDLELTTAVTLRRHIQRKHSPKSITHESCYHCGKTFASIGLLAKHGKYNHHKIGESCTHCGLTLQCDMCNKRFHDRSHVREHVALKHFKKTLHTCTVSTCGEGFYRKQSRDNHMKKMHVLTV